MSLIAKTSKKLGYNKNQKLSAYTKNENEHKKGLLSLFFIISTLVSLAQDTIHLKTYFRDLKSVDIFINEKNIIFF